MILIDTDTLIDIGRNAKEALECLQKIEARYSVAISVVTQMELIVGCRDKNELRHLVRFLERFEILSLEGAICTRAVGLLQQYRLSHGLLIADALIAATAIAVQCRFISKNQRDYRFIENLRLLSYPYNLKADS